VRSRSDEQPPASFKRNEAAIEEVINRWGEEQPILAVEALLVRAVAPWLDVAGPQIVRALDTGDTTTRLYSLNSLSEQTLSAPRHYERFFLGRAQVCIILDLIPEVLLPTRHLRR